MSELIEKLLAELTLDEKLSMVHGCSLFSTKEVERLGIPSITMSDGPMGVRPEIAPNEWVAAGNNDDFVSYIPCNSAIASTWNKSMAYVAGSVLGCEARGRGKDVILAPGINVKRSPLCGRNFEYMSEDPKLIGEMAANMVLGIQKNDVAACVKHFAANSQEDGRLAVDTIVDDRTLNEIYFPGFKTAIDKGNTYSIMGAYNKLNGEFCCTSKGLLNSVLRDKWNYDGMIVSDWGGVNDTKDALESALDVEMDVTYDFDSHYLANPLKKLIDEGKYSIDCLDDKVRNILRLMYRLKMIGDEKANRKKGTYNSLEHQNMLYEVAKESVILLKNEDNVLPLNANDDKKIAVIGVNATMMHAGGGGSAEIKALYEKTPLMGIKMLLGGDAKIAYAPGYFIPKMEKGVGISWQADSTKYQERTDADEISDEQMSQKYLQEAVELAKRADVVIYVGGLDHNYDMEGFDRKNMKLPYNQDELIESLLEVNKDTVVMLYGGSPVSMPWIKKAKAVLFSYYNGMEGGSAIADVIFGNVNPSGKLAETFIKDIEQCPAKYGVNFGMTDRVEHTEGVMVGYRYYNTEKTDVNFCFGHGLSYTDFKYKDMSVIDDGEEIKLRINIANAGDMDGSEAVQIYVAPLFETKYNRPYHELKEFDKVFIKQGEEKLVMINLQYSDFSYYDVEKKNFVVEPGKYLIQVGSSSRDIRLEKEITIK